MKVRAGGGGEEEGKSRSAIFCRAFPPAATSPAGGGKGKLRLRERRRGREGKEEGGVELLVSLIQSCGNCK